MKNLEMLLARAEKKARDDAKMIIREQHCRAFIAERYLNLLKRVDKNPYSPFQGQGRIAYERYSAVLNTILDSRNQGKRLKGAETPPWDYIPEKLNI